MVTSSLPRGSALYRFQATFYGNLPLFHGAVYNTLSCDRELVVEAAMPVETAQLNLLSEATDQQHDSYYSSSTLHRSTQTSVAHSHGGHRGQVASSQIHFFVPPPSPPSHLA